MDFTTLLGMGTGSVSLLSLDCVMMLETSHVILVESLVNRRALMLVGRFAIIKYVGRGISKVSLSFYGILRLVLRLRRDNVKTAWATNGDAVTFNRANCRQGFIRACSFSCKVISGITTSTSALSLAYAHGIRAKTSILSSCKQINNDSDNIAILHMMKMRFMVAIDRLIINGFRSKCLLMIYQSIGTSEGKTYKFSFAQVAFAPSTILTNGPLVVIIYH
ncbi:MAG: hypothetical protein ACKEQK_00360 [Candidatus Hodgkinia cicadicola]